MLILLAYNKKKLEKADYCEIGHNPNCGDEITLELKLNGNMNEEWKNSKKRDYFLCSKDTHNRWRA